MWVCRSKGGESGLAGNLFCDQEVISLAYIQACASAGSLQRVHQAGKLFIRLKASSICHGNGRSQAHRKPGTHPPKASHEQTYSAASRLRGSTLVPRLLAFGAGVSVRLAPVRGSYAR